MKAIAERAATRFIIRFSLSVFIGYEFVIPSAGRAALAQ
jgi:hypothetical protein